MFEYSLHLRSHVEAAQIPIDAYRAGWLPGAQYLVQKGAWAGRVSQQTMFVKEDLGDEILDQAGWADYALA